MVANSTGGFWDTQVMESGLSSKEQELRDLFVEQYFYDFDPVAAALRVGFLPSVANTYARQFMNEGYVLRQIEKHRTQTPENEDAQMERDQQLVFNTLRQAAMNGPFASRVQAAAKLGSFRGMDAIIKTQNDHLHRGGVMLVPNITDVGEWEKAAQASQQKLVEETQEI